MPRKAQDRRKPTPRYESLLAERIRLGRACIDHVVHRESHGDAVVLHRHAQEIERQLTRFRRYSWDQLTVVAPAEDDRWHTPGTLPDCALCITGASGLSARIPLPGPRGAGTP